MIYGKGSKGNYPLLAKFAQKFPIFPNIENKRSMLYIENLCAFVKTIVDDEASGYFYPQNSEYVCTSELVKCIANAHGKRIVLTSIFNPMIKLIKNHPIIKKVFGDIYYAKEMSVYKKNYQVVDFEESIDRTER